MLEVLKKNWDYSYFLYKSLKTITFFRKESFWSPRNYFNMKRDVRKILMINSATKALSLRKKNPEAIPEEIIKHLMNKIEADESSKVLAIAAVNEALKMRNVEKKLTDKQIVQKIMDNSDEIISKAEKID